MKTTRSIHSQRTARASRHVGRWLAVGATGMGLLLPTLAAAALVEGRNLAYVDPGAGSFLLQALVAAMAGIVVAVNAYWRRIRSFLGLGRDDDGDTPDSESRDD
jgi:hypothetical protein